MSATAEDYFTSGPLDTSGNYQRRRGTFDGAIGWLDGFASLVGGVGNVVGEANEIHGNFDEIQRRNDDRDHTRATRDQDLHLERLKVERGDNRQLYLVLAAAAVAAVVLTR